MDVNQIKNIIRGIAARYNANIYLFGSRIWGEPQRYSDLDIAIDCDDLTAIDVQDAIIDSELSMRLDILLFRHCNNEELKKKIIKDGWSALG